MSLTYETPVEGQAWVGPEVDGETAAIRVVNGLAELIAGTGPLWVIDARLSESDLVGSVDPAPMANTLVPGDGTVRVASMQIDEVAFDGSAGSASFLYSADSAALGITGDIDIRGAMSGIDDLTNDGSVPQKIMVSKFQPDPFACDWQLSVHLDGDPCFTWWPGGAGTLEAVKVAATEDPYSATAYRVTRVAATGVVSAWVEDDAAPDVTTADGTNWRLIGTHAGTSGDLSDSTGMTLSFMIGKGLGGWCQVFDGIDGTLVADMDIGRDATAGMATGDTFTANSGETWTLGKACATFACDRAAWLVGATATADGTFAVADADALDIGVGDFTAAMVYEASTVASGGADFRPLFFKADPATIGSTGVGWGFVDYGPLGGVGFALNDGTGLKTAFGPWTAGARHLVVATGDRDGNLRLFIDDMATPVATTDITGVGTLTNALAASSSTPEPALLGAVALWDRVLTADELAALPARLGV